MSRLRANDLKTGGVAAIAAATDKSREARQKARTA